MRRAPSATTWRVISFWAGTAALVLALVSPLHPLGEVLFSAHMVQHEILMLIAAPLLVLSRPLVPLLWALPFEARRAAGRWSKAKPVQTLWRGMTKPAVAWTVHGLAIWLWHAPAAFQATLTSDWVHSAQHISFFATGLLFWWSLFDSRAAHDYGLAVMYLFTTAIHTSILGALLTFARTVWYPAYARTAPLWGLSALEDQQIGGLIMWVPGGLVYLGASLALFWLWLSRSGSVPNRRRLAA